MLRSPANARRLLDALEESKKWDATESPLPHTIDELCSELDIERKKKKKQNSPFDPNIQQVSRFPVFSERFREDFGWWYKTDKQKAYKILDLVEAVMKDPFKGVGKPEPIKYLDTDTWSRRKENFTI